MKKLFIALALILSSLCFVGCKKSTLSIVNANMSEITTDYFYGEKGDYSLSISVGKRENPYLVDGIHHDVVDFSLLIFKDKSQSVKDKELACKFYVNNEDSQLKLIYNPIANAFMFDIGYNLDKKDQISFECNGVAIDLMLVSKGFEISASKAISIASEKFESVISQNNKAGQGGGEFYLKVLGDNNNSKDLFWCFSYVTASNKSYNIIVSVSDGSILASDI